MTKEMKKYYDIESEEIFTEDQIYAFWVQSEKLDFPDFEKWLKEVTGPNGTLEEIAPEYEIENFRKWTAIRIAAQSEMKYEDILKVLRKNNVHGNWTMYEIYNRPVDMDELREMVEQELSWR